MAHTPDLAPYDYLPDAPAALAVGWLEAGRPFPTGTCPPDVVNRLVEFARTPVHLTRGYHFCPFCEVPSDADPRTLPDVARGHGEIWLRGPDGADYAAPELVAHYVEAHRYLPPPAFLDAVRAGVRTVGVR